MNIVNNVSWRGELINKQLHTHFKVTSSIIIHLLPNKYKPVKIYHVKFMLLSFPVLYVVILL